MKSLLGSLLVLFVAAANETDFDVKQANETLHYAWVAYCDEAALRAWDCMWCTPPFGAPKIEIQKYLSDTKAGTQGYVGWDLSTKRIIVSYRGSSNLANTIEDAEFWMTVLPFGPEEAKVEHGFLEAYLSLRNATIEAIASARRTCQDCTVLFTGHSLGAAMATLGAVDLAAAETSVGVQLYNFGSPRVGNEAFVAYVQASLSANPRSYSLRMRRQLDIVPSIPPRMLGYRHIGTEIWDKHTDDAQPDTYVVCDGSGEDESCGDSEEHPIFPLYLLHLKPSEHTRYMSYPGGHC